MKKAGCKKIRVAQSRVCSVVVTDIAKKNLELKKVEAAIVAARKVGIKVAASLLWA
jgi:aryl-phospho-beta-D-glucosidase BglC (GH1 family)